MSYQLNIKKEADYLHVQVTGIRTMETVMSLTTDVLSSCFEHKCSKALIDIKAMSGNLDPLDSYGFSSDYLPGLESARNLKVAVVDLEKNRNFYDMVMYNARRRGLDIYILSDVDKAVELLKEGKWS